MSSTGGGPRRSRAAGGTPGDPGLCAACRHARRQRSARGSVFWRCGRADTEARFRRYPPLPVTACDGFGAADGGC